MQSQGGDEYPTYVMKRRKTNPIGHILHQNCFLKHVIEEKIEGRLEVTGKTRKKT